MTDDKATELLEHRIFPSVVYSTSIDGLGGLKDDLVADILSCVDAQEPGDRQRTREDLHLRPEAHWQRFYEAIGAVVDVAASTLHPPWVSRTFHGWGLVFRSVTDWPSNFMSIHAHSQATFSSVCYLSVPPELSAIDRGGTLIRNPLANIHHRYLDLDYVRFPAVELGILVFPGFLEPLPERPTDEVEFSVPRIVLATDFCYY